jgi:hypothetical protein
MESKNFYVRHARTNEFNKILIGRFDCRFEEENYIIDVYRFVVSPNPRYAIKEPQPCSLKQYHDTSRGAGMGMIGTVESMGTLDRLKFDLFYGSSAPDREDVLLYIPKPTIIITGRNQYHDCEIAPGQSLQTSFGIGDIIGDQISYENIVYDIPREIVYLPTVEDTNEGIYGCIVYPQDGKYKYLICSIIMWRYNAVNLSGIGFTSITEHGDHPFVGFVHTILQSCPSDPHIKARIKEKKQKEINDKRQAQINKWKEEKRQRNTPEALAEKARQAEDSRLRREATQRRSNAGFKGWGTRMSNQQKQKDAQEAEKASRRESAQAAWNESRRMGVLPREYYNKTFKLSDSPPPVFSDLSGKRYHAMMNSNGEILIGIEGKVYNTTPQDITRGLYKVVGNAIPTGGKTNTKNKNKNKNAKRKQKNKNTKRKNLHSRKIK